MAKKKLKIAFLSFYSGLIQRGVETLVREVAPRIAKEYDITVFQAGQPVRGVKYPVVQIPVKWSGKLEDPLTLGRRFYLDKTSQIIKKFTSGVLPLLRQEKFDIIVPWNNGWETILCRLSAVGKVVTVGQAGIGWDDRVNLWTFPSSFVGFTSFQCSWAKKVNPFVKVVKIPNGVDAKRFVREGPKLHFDLPRPIILCVAALVPMKRQELAIRAVSRLKKGSLLLVGKGELKEELQTLGNQILPGRFKIIEASFQDIDKIYRTVDLFTFPTSGWESFGIVLLEAMASGLAVVATNDPIRREIVGEAGLFVDPTDIEKYAKTLEEALNSDWNNKPRKQAEKFSWDEIARKYEQLFEELVSRRNDEK